MREDFDSSPLDGNDPGGGGSVTGVGDKVGVVVRADQTKDEDTDDVEQEDADPDTTNGARNVLGRVTGFGGCHSENLGSQKRVGSIDQDRPNTGKSSKRSRDALILGESAGVMLRNANSVTFIAGIQKLRNVPSSGTRDDHGWEHHPDR